MAADSEARAKTGFGRSASLLSAGVGAAGLITYAYFSLASHNLPAREYGEIVVAWSTVFVTISVLERPVEQFISRSIAANRARGLPIAGPLRTAGLLQAGVATGFAILALVLRGPLEDGLFDGATTLYWVYFGAVIGFAASFLARGFLAGEGRFGLLAALLVVESSARAAFALAVALGIASGQDAVALGIVAAPCISLIVVPFAALRRGRGTSSSEPASRRPVAAAAGSGLIRGGSFAAAVSVVMLSEQTLLNAGPLLLRALEDAAAAGFIFNVLLLARAPLVVFQGVAISLLPHLTRLRSRGGRGAEFRGSVSATLKLVAGFTVLVLAIVAVAGPELMQLAFGDEFEYERFELLVVATGMGFYLAATTLNQAALAQGQARRAAACWAICAAGFLIWDLVPVLDPEPRIAVGFSAAAIALCGLLARVYAAPRPRPGEVPSPGSADELEAELALADEAS